MCWANCASNSKSGSRSEDRAACCLVCGTSQGRVFVSRFLENFSGCFVVLDGAITRIFSCIALACTTARPLSC